MTAAELTEIARGVAAIDTAAITPPLLARVERYNARVLLLEPLLRRARAALDSGGRIEPEVADTIRVSAHALRAKRARLLDPTRERT